MAAKIGNSVWKKVNDEDVRHVWKTKTTGRHIYVSPDWYEQNGTPVGYDDEDAIYVRTEIKKKKDVT